MIICINININIVGEKVYLQLSLVQFSYFPPEMKSLLFTHFFIVPTNAIENK